MKISVRCFAMVKDIAGKEEHFLDLPEGSTVSSVLTHFALLYPSIEQWRPYIRMAVNRKYVTEDEVLRSDDEVALIPPVSGG